MADDRNPRPVSGEIMAGAAAGSARMPAIASGDALDAEFETVTASDPSPARPAAPTSTPAGLASLRAGDPAPGGRGGAVFWSAGLAAVIVAFWASGGHAILGAPVPADASVRAERGAHALRIENVVSRTQEGRDGRFVLFVDGDARNGSDAPHDLPAIDIAVTGSDGTTARYLIDTGARRLAPGESHGFSSRLDAPAGGVRSVSVTFREEPR